MSKLLIPLVVGVIILVTQVATGVSAQTPNYSNYQVAIPTWEPEVTPIPDRCLNPETSSVDCFPDATPVPDTCWDCLGSTMTPEEARAIYCSPTSLEKNPQMVDECFPSSTPTLTPEQSPTEELTPEPTPTVVPTPEATETVVAP